MEDEREKGKMKKGGKGKVRDRINRIEGGEGERDEERQQKIL